MAIPKVLSDSMAYVLDGTHDFVNEYDVRGAGTAIMPNKCFECKTAIDVTEASANSDYCGVAGVEENMGDGVGTSTSTLDEPTCVIAFVESFEVGYHVVGTVPSDCDTEILG